MRALLLKLLIGGVMRSIRYRTENEEPTEELLREGSPFVLVFWHGSMAWPWWRFRNSNAAALVSMSKDGQLLAGLLRLWGYTVLRGSSSRGSKEAMQAMREALQQGRVLCVTPDGPRGPYHEMKMGAVRVAQTEGVPLVMVNVGYRRRLRLRSWDRFEIPLPFSVARVRFSDPMYIAKELDGAGLDEHRAVLEKQMLAEYRIVTLEDVPE
jgi:lysophospholipid acyltransferase (LPLAT)-like uncharacterized protein